MYHGHQKHGLTVTIKPKFIYDYDDYFEKCVFVILE